MHGRLEPIALREIDPQLAAQLAKLQHAHNTWERMGRPPQLLVDGVNFDDLYLTFTLPGQPSYQLCPGGSAIPVSAATLPDYLKGVLDATLGQGIAAQASAFREGFAESIPLKALHVLYTHEVEQVLGAGNTLQPWGVEELRRVVRFDHGYSSDSSPAVGLLEVMSEFTVQEQRLFLKFVTGAPCLPPGGLASLHPRLTVVRKHSSTTGHDSANSTPLNSFKEASVLAPLVAPVDRELPSVMTCANYIKLPAYSCKQVLRERLVYAMTEG